LETKNGQMPKNGCSERRKWSGMSRQKRSIARGCTGEVYDAAINSKVIQELARPKPNMINFHLGFLLGLGDKIDLRHIRYFLVVVNLCVLGALVETAKGWVMMETIKRELSRSDQFHINRWLKHGIGPIETITIAKMDDFFEYTSLCLFFYWVVFGFRVCLNYGAEKDLYCLLLAFPAIVVLALVEIYLSYVILNINQALSELDCNQLRDVLSYNNLSMIVDLRDFMVAEGVRIAALFVTSALVQFLTGILPFYLSDLPFQRRLYMDDFLFNDLKRTDNFEVSDSDRTDKRSDNLEVDPNNNEVIRANKRMASVKYPCAAKSLMLRLCRPEVREFHRRKQIVDANPDLPLTRPDPPFSQL